MGHKHVLLHANGTQACVVTQHIYSRKNNYVNGRFEYAGCQVT